MRRILTVFARLALVAGPIVVVLGVLMLAGVMSGGASGGGAMTGARTADAGERLQVSAVAEPRTLWVTPADADLSGAQCVTSEGDSYPLTSGAVADDGAGTAWVQVSVVDSALTQVSCDGGGIERFAVADLASSHGARGGVFFMVWGIIVTGAGLVAWRLRR
jgi:hypothetical protein